MVEVEQSPRGEWDADRLLQLFSNLMSNAITHGAVDSPVQVRIDGTGPSVVTVSIHNAGAIPGDIVPALLDPFRGSDQTQRRSKGLGLGLFITRQIAIAHGGDVEVESTAVDGTTFRVRLPRTAGARS